MEIRIFKIEIFHNFWINHKVEKCKIRKKGKKLRQYKVIMQGKLFHRCTHLLYCSVLSLGGNANTRRMSQPDIGSIQCFYPPRILHEHWCIYSCFQIPPRENWFQYVRRVYATAINFPCIIWVNPCTGSDRTNVINTVMSLHWTMKYERFKFPRDFFLTLKLFLI